MKFSSMRSAIVIASAIVGSLIPSQTFAQTNVLSGGTYIGDVDENATSTYRFTGSMILNSVGFVTLNGLPASLSYSIKGTTYSLGTHFFDSDLSVAENGIRWLNLTPQSMVQNDIVTVTGPRVLNNFSANDSVNVVYEGLVSNGGTPNVTWTNSNLRVSPANPGSNVAPEPGSFALALTGGAALIGICVRRRRNAG